MSSFSPDPDTDAEAGNETAAPAPVRRPRRELSLADQLAIERTNLANERTCLAYVLTCVALLAAGLTLLKFFTSNGMHMLGYTLLPIAVGTLVLGLMKFHETKVRIDAQVAKNQSARQ
jgi:putative membrane protein